jgi:hypothetical protein
MTALGENSKLSNWILFNAVYETLIEPNLDSLLTKLNTENYLKYIMQTDSVCADSVCLQKNWDIKNGPCGVQCVFVKKMEHKNINDQEGPLAVISPLQSTYSNSNISYPVNSDIFVNLPYNAVISLANIVYIPYVGDKFKPLNEYMYDYKRLDSIMQYISISASHSVDNLIDISDIENRGSNNYCDCPEGDIIK